MKSKYAIVLIILLSSINVGLWGQTVKNSSSLTSKEINVVFKENKSVLKGALNQISSLSTTYCSESGFDDIVHESWAPTAETIVWIIRTNLASEGIVDHPTWGDVIGTGSSTIFQFHPERITDPKYFGARIYFNYVQYDALGFVVPGAGATDYTTVYETPDIFNFGSDKTICAGEPNPVLTLVNSQTGFSYQLYKNGILDGSALPVDGSTGSPINFTVASAGLYTVEAKNVADNSCLSIMNGDATVVINPLPNVTASYLNGPLCVGEQLDLVGGTAGLNYAWSGPASFSSTDQSPTVTASATLAHAGVYTLQGTDLTTGCKTTRNTNVIINPNPIPIITGSNSVCAGTTGVTYTTETGMSGYTWSVSAGGAITAGAGTNQVTVTWNTAGAQTVSVNYTNGTSCTATSPTSFAVTVNALPVPIITGSTPVCQNSTTSYTTEAGMTGYVWTVTGGSITAGAGTNSISVNWTGVGAQTVTVTYINGTNCSPVTPTSFPVNVTALPVPTISGPISVCQNATGVVYTTESGMIGYTWTITGGTITAGGTTNSITVTWSTVGTQSLTVNYVQSGCSAATPTSYNVTVNALPVPTITGLNSVCAGTTGVTYTTEVGMTGYTWSVSAGGSITAGAGTNQITVTWNTAGAQTVSVNYTNGTSCTATSPTSSAVTVNALPVPIITGSTPVCQNSTTTYTTESGMTGYVWTVTGGSITAGTGTNSISVNWTGVGAQTVTVTYINGTNCSPVTPTSFPVNVTALPVPTISGPISVCQNATGVVYTTESGMTGYTWTITGGTITAGGTTNSITVTWSTVGTQSLTVNYVQSGCSAATPTSYNVTVNALPVPTITGLNSVCAGTTGVTYTTEVGMTGYTWSVSAGGALTAGAGTNQITVTWNTAGAQTVSVNYTNGTSCTAASPTNSAVTVNALPVPIITGSTPVCQNSTTTYTTESGMTGYVWTVTGGNITAGSGTSSISVNWISVGAQTVTVTYINGTNCSPVTPTSFPVNVTALPVPTISGPISVCQNASGVVYTTESGMTGYAWTITGGTINSGNSTNSISVTWGTLGPQSLTVNYVQSGCSAASPTTYTVNVNSLPVPTITGSNSICAGTTGVIYTTEAGMTGYTWAVSAGGAITAGSGTNQITVTWSGIGAQTISVNYTNGTNCTASTATIKPVSVNVVDISLSVNPPASPSNTKVCVGQSLTYQANASLGSGSYTYQFEQRLLPAGVFSVVYSGPSNIFTTATNLVAGSYELRATVTDNIHGCTDFIVSSPFEVVAFPVVTLTPSPAPGVCFNQTATLTATPSGFANYTFNIDGVSINNGINNIYSTNSLTVGTHSIYVSVSNGTCTSSSNPAINYDVFSLPTVTLVSNKSTGIACENEIVTFTASGANTYQFYVDGVAQGPISPNPVFTYGSLNNFTVTVDGYNANNCAQALPRPASSITISKPVGNIAPVDTTICAGDPITFTATGGVSYIFEINDANPVAQVSPTFGPLTTLSNNDKVSVVAIDVNGCSAAEVVSNVIVNIAPTSNIVSDKIGNAVCAGSPIKFTATSNIGNEFEFFVNNVSVQARGPLNTFTTSSLTNGDNVHVHSYVGSTGCGTVSSDITVTVNPLPVVSITSVPGTTIIQGTTIDFTATAIAGATYQWTVNSVPVGTNSNLYSSATLVNGDSVDVRVVDVNGCIANDYEIITVLDVITPVTTLVSPAGYCTTSATGVAFTISSPQTGVEYALYRTVGNVLVGVGSNSGSVVSWSDIKNLASGTETYYVLGYYPALPSNTTTVSSGLQVIEYALPIIYNVTPTGTVTDCNGGAGYVVSLNSTQVGVDYSLYRDGVEFGTIANGYIIPGTGSGISFPATKTGGVYTVKAKLLAIGACEVDMNGIFTIDLSGLGAQYDLIPSVTSGEYCAGTSGVGLSLNGSQNGVDYVLVVGGTTSVDTIVGTGAALNFGIHKAGVYTVEVRSGGCSLSMNNAVTITEIPLSNAYNLDVEDNGFYCKGSAGVKIFLEGQQAGVTYKLYQIGVIAPVSTQTGLFDNPTLPVDFGVFNVDGAYYATAESGSLNCSVIMNDTVDLVGEELPQSVIFSSLETAYCQGSTIDLTIENSRSNTKYFLVLNSTLTGDFIDGVDGPVAFTVNQPGTYTLEAEVTNANTICRTVLTNSLVITETALPTQRVISQVAGTGTACDNGAIIQVENSENNITYILYRNATATSQTIVGDGNTIEFTTPIVDNGGSYTVMAQANPGSCEVLMTSAPIVVSIPGVVASFNLTPASFTNKCANDNSGYVIGLDGSEVGIQYTLFTGTTDVETIVSTVAGPFNFAAVTAAGTYQVRAVNPADVTCQVVMPNSVVVAYNVLPSAGLVSDKGTTIVNGSDVVFTASGGINYEFFVNGVSIQGFSLDETFGPINTLNDGDVVSVNVTDGNGCSSSVSLTMGVLANLSLLNVAALPDAFCESYTNGVNIVLSNPESGIIYELFNSTTSTNIGQGSIVGNEVIWSNVTNSALGSEEYYVEGYYIAAPGTKVEMANRVIVTRYPEPTVFDVTPNTTVTDCAAPIGHTINLSGSELGVEYRLYVDGVYNGIYLLGNGNSLDFTNILTGGAHSIKAVYPNTVMPDSVGCPIDMNGVFTVSLASSAKSNLVSLPTDGKFCSGSTGVTLSLDNSESAIEYILMRGLLPLDTITSLGGVLSLGTYNVEGTYTAYAIRSGCIVAMNGSITTEQIDAPLAHAVKAENNGEFCLDDTDGVEIYLESQQPGYEYELLFNGTPIDTIISTHTSPFTDLSFGMHINAGTYTIRAMVPTLGCNQLMTGSATLVAQPLVVPFNFLAVDTVYCTGGTTTLYIPNSANNTVYLLLRNGAVLGTPVNGNGNRIDFVVSQVGNYKIQATRLHPNVSCPFIMDDADAISVTESALPNNRVVTFIDGSDCDNGTIIKVALTEVGIDYLVVNTVTNTPLPNYILKGNGADQEFAPVVDNGNTYKVVARNIHGCETSLSPNIPVNIVGAVTKQTVTVPASICLGDGSVVIGLSDSQVGVRYSLYGDSVLVDTEDGTGSAITFDDVYNEAQYYVVGENTTAPTCPNEMLNRVEVKYNPLPKAFKLTGSGFYCNAAEPAIVGLDGSEWEVNYTLLLIKGNKKQFIETIPGSYTGDSLSFSGVTTSGIYGVFAKTLLGCTSSMKDSVTVESKSTPTKYDLILSDTTFCSSEDGVDLSLSGMEMGVEYLVINTVTGDVKSVIGNVNANDTTFLTKLNEGIYDIKATWGGDACIVGLNTLPVDVSTSPVVSISPSIDVSTNISCSNEPIIVTLVSTLESDAVYDLVVDGVIQNNPIKGDTVSTVSWDFVGTVGGTQFISTIAYLENHNNCALSSNGEFVQTKASPQAFNVLPSDTTFYCIGEKGISIGIDGSQADVYYELIRIYPDTFRVDYYVPTSSEVGSPFNFRLGQYEGDYIVTGRFFDGGCTSIMNDTVVVLEDSIQNCTNLIAIDDFISLAQTEVTKTDSLFRNDIYSPFVDTLGVNTRFELITEWSTFDGTNTVDFKTIGEASVDKFGAITYTKLPGFFGLDSVKYIVENVNVPSRIDTATVIFLVGNHQVDGGTLLIPNMISPNGDAYNQAFVVTGMLEDKLVSVNDPNVKSNLEIYNRWGTLVYRSSGGKYMNDWEGKGNGTMVSIGDDLPSGTYYYIFKITYNLSTGDVVDKVYNGFVELVR